MKPSAHRTKCRIANGWKLGSENKPASSDYSLLPYKYDEKVTVRAGGPRQIA